MKIYTIPIGPVSSNMYLLVEGDFSFIIDPSVDREEIKDLPSADSIKAVFITHGHFDHIYAVDSYKGIPVYMPAKDRELLNDPAANGSFLINSKDEFVFESIDSSEFDKEPFGPVKVTAIKTPGHTAGSVCYLFETEDDKVLFSGDTLFHYGMGRTDLPTGSDEDMIGSLKLLKELPADLKVFPGHGEATSIGIECASNPYLRMI